MVPIETSTSHQVHIMETFLTNINQQVKILIIVDIKRFLQIQVLSNNFHFQRSYQQTVTCQVYILRLLTISNILLIRRVVMQSACNKRGNNQLFQRFVEFVATELIRDSAACHCLSIYFFDDMSIFLFRPFEYYQIIKQNFYRTQPDAETLSS